MPTALRDETTFNGYFWGADDSEVIANHEEPEIVGSTRVPKIGKLTPFPFNAGQQGISISAHGANYTIAPIGEVDFSEIDNMYLYTDPTNEKAVKAFVRENRSLLPILSEAKRYIQPYFGESGLTAQLINDPDSPQHKLLAIFIATTYSPKEASDKLDELFLSEWGSTLYEASDCLFVSVKFQ